MNKYRDKSDSEINELVSFSLGYVHTKSFAPCNNPVQETPIIIENKISVNYIDKDIGWGAYHFDEEKGELEIYDKNYYRAAMICFLIMKDAENEKV
ncbi:phage protein NinX family protein [Morganella morganii]|uniref:phage protein NinX family protein n=1 Tax=Morganella morganii TaxID=582 RepID=UPI003B9E06E3